MGSLRGRLQLGLSAGPPLQLATPPEVELPYVIQTSPDLAHWSDWLTNGVPRSPLTLPWAATAPIGFLWARGAESTDGGVGQTVGCSSKRGTFSALACLNEVDGHQRL